MTFRCALFAFVLVLSLPRCDLVEAVAEAEFVRFQYVLADVQQTGNGLLVYRLPPGTEAGCTDFARLDSTRLVDYIDAVQNDTIDPDCFSTFSATGDNAVRLSLSRTGPDGLTINAARSSSSANTEPDPNGFVMSAEEGQTEDVASSWGTATFRFGAGGPEFECAGRAGDLPWTVSNGGDGGRASYFRFETTSIGGTPDRASGEFRCLARNATDTNDRRLLLIIGGDFQMQF